MKRRAEWGIGLSPISKRRWRHRILWKLVLINALVIGILIWLAGVTVKDFACFLVGQDPRVSAQDSARFNETMRAYLIQMSLLAVVVAGSVHYFLAKRILTPLRRLSAATRQLAQGRYPTPLPVAAEDEIGQLTADFNDLNDQLRQKEELRKKMVADIAHELRTPLTNIDGYLEALSDGVIEGNKQLFRSLREESLRITRLVEELHELSVWESRKESAKKMGVVALKPLIEASVRAFSIEARKRGVAIAQEVDEGQTIASEDGLKQALHNLLKNAIRYDQGGWVKVEGRWEGDRYRVIVSNEGTRIPRQEAERLFDRFYRLDPSRNRASGGAGLGLAIVKEIVEQHGGDIGIDTDEKVHSFWFVVPVRSEQDAPLTR